MKLFRVVFDVDNGPVATPDKSTAIRRETRFYVAARLELIWEEIKIDRYDMNMNLIAIIEESPSVRIISTPEGYMEQFGEGE